MELRAIASATFDAMHVIPGYEPCSMPHGHSWVIDVEVGGDLDPKTGWVRGCEHLHEDVERWARELHNGNLGELLPGVVTSPLGVASAALDALALKYPRALTIRVLCSDGSRGEVSRTPRQL